MNPRLRVSICAGLATFLGSLSLLPIFDNFGWIPRVLLLIGLLMLTSITFQRVRFLAPAAPLAMVAVGLFTLTALYAHGVALLGFLPGPAVFRLLHETASSGFSDSTQLTAPVPVTRGLSLLTTGGIGIVTVIVETLASSLRRPAVAGLPLLAIFTVPAAILTKGVGWQPFLFAAIGYLTLLLAEGRERVSRWGRPIRATAKVEQFGATSGATAPRKQVRQANARAGTPPRRNGGLATAQLTQAGRRVGAVAIGVAVIVPVAIPGLHAGWFGTHRTGSGNGNGLDVGIGGTGSEVISPIVSLQRDLTLSKPVPLFSYTTTAANPDYLRMLSLDNFNGKEWAASSLTSSQDTNINKGISALTGITVAPTGTTRTDITVSRVLHEPYLPLPALPTKIKAHGSWLFNPSTSVVYSLHSSTTHLSYQVESDVVAPNVSFLNSQPENSTDPVITKDSQPPANVPEAIVQDTDAIVAAAHANTPYQIAVALQNYFVGSFVYDVRSAPGDGYGALLSFLNDRRGYCEQFAATMALMARIEGIPARVDVGFTPGVRQGSGNTYQVTTADAHAWPELYFPGAGWLRFEPTPRSDGQAQEPTYTQPSAAIKPGASTAPTPDARPPRNLGAGIDPDQIPHHIATPVTSSTTFGQSLRSMPWGWILLSLLVVLALVAAPGIRWWRRRRNWANATDSRARAHAGWDDLGEDLRDLALPWTGQSDTPRCAAASLLSTHRLDGPARIALINLARAEEFARYTQSGRAVEGFDPSDGAATIRRSLYASVSWRRRFGARLAPRSSFRYLGYRWGDVQDSAQARMRDWVRPATSASKQGVKTAS